MSVDLVLAARVALAVVFAFAALAKFRDWSASGDAAAALGVPGRFAAPVGRSLPVVELGAAALLLVPGTARVGAFVGASLLGVFSAVIAGNLVRGKRPSCNCFGAFDDRPIGTGTIVRNGVLAALAALVLLAPGPQRVTLSRGDADTGIVLVCLAQAAAIIVLLLRQRRLEERVSRFEARPTPAGLPVGAEAPDFVLEAVADGARVGLGSLLRDRRVLVAFTDPGCSPCKALYPELADWQRSLSGVLDVVVIADGDRAAVEEEVGSLGLGNVFVPRRGDDVAAAFAYAGTPGAVLVEAGRIGSAVMTGGAEIRRLVTDAAREARLDASPLAELDVGDLAPALRLPSVVGVPVDLADLSGGLVVVLFMSPDCPHCRNAMPAFLEKERLLEQAGIALVVVSTGDVARNRAMGFRSQVLIDDGLLTSRAFGVNSTPSAILVDARSKIASGLAIGTEAIWDLIDDALRMKQLAGALSAGE